MKKEALRKFWEDRYKTETTGWDIGYPSPPITQYADGLEDKNLKILIPGAGNAYEAEYLHQKGFSNVFIIDIAEQPLSNFKQRVPDFPSEHLIQEDFFAYDDQFDLIFEQTFFCSFPPTLENRMNYVKKMHSLLKDGAKLVGLWFDIPLTGDMVKRPFGGNKELYLSYFKKHFTIKCFEKCYNSIEPRKGNEFFGILEKSAL